MTKLNTFFLAALTAIIAFSVVKPSHAQNVITVPVNATVQNAITLALIDPLQFGTIIAINDAVETASVTISTGDAQSFATTSAPALTGAVTGTPTAAEVTSAGVIGATINLTVNNVVNPTDGTDTFTLDTFIQNVNGAGDTPVVVGTPFAHTALALDTILIGATITTPAQAAQIADGTYAGSFDIVASY